MADITDIRTVYHWIAIDVARYWNIVLIETASGQRHRFKMSNTAQDFERLITFIRNLGGQARAALEPTGDYHRALAYRLAQAGVEVVSISSVAQSRYREAMFNSWDKNDPKDAGVILEMLKQGRTQQYVDPMLAGHHDLQELSKTYYQISRARTRVQHSIVNHHIPLYFPEMHKYWSSTRSEWWVRFMIEFPTPAHVRQLSREAFVAAAWGIVGRKVNKQNKLEEIWSIAQHSAALPHMPESLAVETFRMTLRHFQQLTALRAEIEQRAEAVLYDNPDYACLKSLPGIGPIIALTILARAGICAALGIIASFSNIVVLILRRTSRECSGVTLSYPNEAMRACAWLSGWPVKSLSVCAKTPSRTNTSAISARTLVMPICAARL